MAVDNETFPVHIPGFFQGNPAFRRPFLGEYGRPPGCNNPGDSGRRCFLKKFTSGYHRRSLHDMPVFSGLPNQSLETRRPLSESLNAMADRRYLKKTSLSD